MTHSFIGVFRIEVAFGLWKGAFKCLDHGILGTRASIRMQIEACALLHNFLRRHGRPDRCTVQGELKVACKSALADVPQARISQDPSDRVIHAQEWMAQLATYLWKNGRGGAQEFVNE